MSPHLSEVKQALSGVLLALLTLLAIGCATGEQKPTLEDISWLLGTWETQGEERKLVEKWTEESDTAMKGTGVFLSRGDTTYMEKLRIEMRNGDIFYVADVPQNPEPVTFKLTSYKESEVTFGNPEHDFPQRIIYALQPNGTLPARAEGTEKNGKYRTEEFRFSKAE